MCLAVLALKPSSPVVSCPWNWIVVANRDESHARPSANMQPWDDVPDILAGQDLQAGGSWLGVHRDGRIALLTNYREPGLKRDDAPSRGHLVEGYLKQSVLPREYLKPLAEIANTYNGFNLLLGSPTEWWHASNRADPFSRQIDVSSCNLSNETTQHNLGNPRIYGLSNALFDTPWPKVIRTRRGVEVQLQNDRLEAPWQTIDALATVFQDTKMEPDHNLPMTGLSLERERLLSSPFIKSPTYGTRCTTVIMQTSQGDILAQEITYLPDGSESGRSAWCSNKNEPWVCITR